MLLYLSLSVFYFVLERKKMDNFSVLKLQENLTQKFVAVGTPQRIAGQILVIVRHTAPAVGADAHSWAAHFLDL